MRTCWGEVLSAVGCLAFFLFSADAQAAQRFEISFPTAVHAGSITGRAYVVITKTDTPEPRLVAGRWGDSGPLLGVDGNEVGEEGTEGVDGSTCGARVQCLRHSPG